MDSGSRRVALVTGGARGIGAATCIALAQAGFNIALADVRPGEEGQEVARQVARLTERVEVFTADVGSVGQCRKLANDVIDCFGRIDGLVNNAGGSFNDYTPFEQTSEELYDRVLAVNLKGPYFLTQACAAALRAHRGAVVNIGSELVYRGYELTAPYVAAKGGVVALTRSMALALAPEVRVNAVAPGPTATERFKTERWYTDERLDEIPLGRFGDPADVAAAIAFFLSPGGNHVTGQTLSVNGGVVMP
jgi:NAD(P)-dependent dehydrogenase (short-subunit alcohol dehydrogenase family)